MDKGKPKLSWEDMCEDEDFQKNLNYFRSLGIPASSLCDYMSEDSQGIRIEDFTPTQED